MKDMNIIPPDFDPMKVEKTSSEFIQTANCLNFNFHAGEVFYLDYDHTKLDEVDLGSGEFPEISVKVNKKAVETVRMESKIELSREQLMDLESLKRHDISALDYMISSTNNDYVSRVEKNLYDLYEKLSLQTKEHNLSKYHKFMRKLFKIEPVIYAKTSEELVKKLFLHSNLIAIGSRRGPANFAIVDMQTSSLLQDDPRFVYESNVPQGYSVSTIYPIGNVSGIRIYVNPYVKYNDGTIILGKATKSQEPGVIFGEYHKHIENYETPMGTTVFSVVGGVCIKEIGETVQRNYIQFKVLHTEKPWWRKLFKL